jgi:hypothetical protein
MCHFITLVVPTTDDAAVRALMARHGRAADPIQNPSVARVLEPGERQYLTTPGHCDCGTVLARRHERSSKDLADDLAKEAAKLKRKGWSEAKIARALDDRRKAADKPEGGGGDSLEQWAAIVGELHRELAAPRVGLMVHLYSGRVADEDFATSRRVLPAGRSLSESMGPLEPDELTIFERA